MPSPTKQETSHANNLQSTIYSKLSILKKNCKSFIMDTSMDEMDGIEEITGCYELIKPGENKRKLSEGLDKKLKKKRKKSKPRKQIDYSNSTANLQEDLDLSAWYNYFLPEPIMLALKDLGFTKPTPIQELTLPAAIRDRQDILGAAETGSGKTLAFGIPIITHIIHSQEKEETDISSMNPNPLRCLVLTPTRELAIQVKNHLLAITKHTSIRVAVVVGGMSLEKQRRVLRKGPDIVIATPGRLWELIDEGEEHFKNISLLNYLVIDEADTMVQKGHFEEITQIFSLINGKKSYTKSERQTFVFSATLTMAHELPKRVTHQIRNYNYQKEQKLDSFIKIIGMKKNAKVIDITKKSAVVDTLVESQIMCEMSDKDAYLYYFLLMHPGRTLVFCNSIDSVRRLRTILEYLCCNPLLLHASMQQRQRLKNLDRFRLKENSILLATDVASRGLDIKGIEHVIHYHVPRTVEIYVHRSGRTARAENAGLSVMLIDAQDVLYYQKICKTLNKDKELPSFPINESTLKVLKERVTLAQNIDKSEHKTKKHMDHNRWFRNSAKYIDVELDEDLLKKSGDSQERAAKSQKIKLMKKHLSLLVKKPLLPKSLGCYPTKSGKLIVSPSIRSEKALKVMSSSNDMPDRKRKRKKLRNF